MEPGTEQAMTLPLRDIHLPDPVGWWPPAYGWWLLAASILALILVAALWYRRGRSRRRLKQYVLTEHRRIEQQFNHNRNDHALASELSGLLRQVAMTTGERASIANLTGEQWLAYLDAGLDGKPFSRHLRTALTEAPYRAGVPVDSDTLLRTSRLWIVTRLDHRSSPNWPGGG